jgi:hypothetical protein
VKVQVELRISPVRPLWTMCSRHSVTQTFVTSTERCVIEALCNTSIVQLGTRLDRIFTGAYLHKLQSRKHTRIRAAGVPKRTSNLSSSPLVRICGCMNFD